MKFLDHRLERPHYYNKPGSRISHLIAEPPQGVELPPRSPSYYEFAYARCDFFMDRDQSVQPKTALPDGTRLCRSCVRSVLSALHWALGHNGLSIGRLMGESGIEMQLLHWKVNGTKFCTPGVYMVPGAKPGEVLYRFRADGRDWCVELQILDLNTWTWAAKDPDHDDTFRWISRQLVDHVLAGRLLGSQRDELEQGLFEDL